MSVIVSVCICICVSARVFNLEHRHLIADLVNERKGNETNVILTMQALVIKKTNQRGWLVGWLFGNVLVITLMTQNKNFY